jgi:hypothetical protein
MSHPNWNAYLESDVEDAAENSEISMIRYGSAIEFDESEFLGLTERRTRFIIQYPIRNEMITKRFQRAFARFRAILRLSNIITDI